MSAREPTELELQLRALEDDREGAYTMARAEHRPPPEMGGEFETLMIAVEQARVQASQFIHTARLAARRALALLLEQDGTDTSAPPDLH